MRLASSPAVPRRSPSRRSSPAFHRVPQPPITLSLSASPSQPRRPPPFVLPPFVPRLLPRPAARLRPVAVHYLIPCPLPYHSPAVPRRSSPAFHCVLPPPASVPLPPIALSLSVSLSQSHRPPPPMPCDAQISRMPFVARSARSGTPRRFPAALLSSHPSPAKFPCHLAAAGGIVV